jgi:mannose-6-phosphate isomerase-like protein (cupin superfamily)
MEQNHLELIIIYTHQPYQRPITSQHHMPPQNCIPPTQSDYGPHPFTTDLVKAARHNQNFRTAIWTGKHLQTTLMCIPPGGEIGLEVHPDTDQLLFIAEGCGITQMGECKENAIYQQPLYECSAVFVPCGMWHNVVNTGSKPLKLFSVYAPPEHPHGTVEK